MLRIDPENQEALIDADPGADRPLRRMRGRRRRGTPANCSPRLRGEYERAYYAGIIAEREGIAWLRSDKPRCGEAAYDCFRQAMAHFEKAEALRPPANDDALLRWNSCAG